MISVHVLTDIAAEAVGQCRQSGCREPSGYRIFQGSFIEAPAHRGSPYYRCGKCTVNLVLSLIATMERERKAGKRG